MTNPRAEVAATTTSRPSRAEIETLCLLGVAELGDCQIAELTTRLGLAAELAPAITEAIQPLVKNGQLDICDGIVSLTEVGRTRLRTRLAEVRALSSPQGQLV